MCGTRLAASLAIASAVVVGCSSKSKIEQGKGGGAGASGAPTGGSAGTSTGGSSGTSTGGSGGTATGGSGGSSTGGTGGTGGSGGTATGGSGGTGGCGTTGFTQDIFDNFEDGSWGAVKPAKPWQTTGDFQVVELIQKELRFKVLQSATSLKGVANARLDAQIFSLANVRLRAKVRRTSCASNLTIAFNAEVASHVSTSGSGFRWRSCGNGNGLVLWAGDSQKSAPVPTATGGDYFVQVSFNAVGAAPKLEVAQDAFPGECGAKMVGTQNGQAFPTTTGSTFFIGLTPESQNGGYVYVDDVEIAH